jgi:hypothetical protein
MSETVKQLIQSRLAELGADGLHGLNRDCVCTTKNLMYSCVDFKYPPTSCVPGYKHKDGKIHLEKEQ